MIPLDIQRIIVYDLTMTNHINFIVRNAVTDEAIASFKTERHARDFLKAASLPPTDISIVQVTTVITEMVILTV